MKDFFENIDRKTLIIGATVIGLVIAIIIFAAVLFAGTGDRDTESDGAETTDAVPEDSVEFDTSVKGEGSEDPENSDLSDEDGAEVDASDVNAERGSSLGIDVSKWQGKIDWQSVAKTGIDFAYIRIGYRAENGNIYKDDNADYNIQQAEKAGLLIGVYFFSTAIDEKEACEEARWTVEAVEGYPVSYPIVYDCEGFRSPTSRMYLVSHGQRTKNALAFLKTVSDAGYEAMHYGARNELSDSAYWNISEIESKYMVWVAQYPAVTYPSAERPDYNGRCDAWQYTNKGKVPGIEGNVDMLVCYFEREAALPKNKDKRPADAKVPLTDEEKLYTEVNEKVTAKDVTNLRKAATTKSDVVAALKNGETAVRTGIGSNGWSRLEYKGQTVYAITSYLTTDLSLNTGESADQDIVLGQTFSAREDSVTAKEIVNLRSEPTTDSEVVATLKRGDYLERTAVSDKGWSRLTYNGKDVYAVTSYLTTEKTTPETQPPETSPVYSGYTPVDEQVTAKVETNLRSAPSTGNSEVVYTLKNGEYVRRTGIHTNGWSRLEYNGQTVYAITSYLTTSKTDEDGFEAVDEQVTAKSVTNLRTAPSVDNSEVVYALKNGEYVQRIGISQNGWSKLLYNGQIVYAMTSYLTE